MAEKFLRVQTYPLNMTPDELTTTLGGQPDSVILRTLLMAEVYAIRGGAKRESRTLRNVWYTCVKPVLSRLGILDQQTKHGNDVRWDKNVSKYLAELVRDGLTSYSELKIVDGSRLRQVAIPVVESLIELSLVGAHYPHLILFTEKDTMWREVETIATLYGTSAISGAGEPSLTCTHNVVEEILQRGKSDIILLALTDYDQDGYTIARAQFAQLVEAVDGKGEVNYDRLGLYPDQLTLAERQANAYKPPNRGLKEWYAETGGVDGQPLGLELDALPLSRLRNMYAEAIERHIDLGWRRNDLREAFIDAIACELLLPEFERKRATMKDQVKSAALWETITSTSIPSNLFRLVARMGWDKISPDVLVDGKPLFDCGEEVRALMREVH